MARFACFALGVDRPGIVAAVTGALYERGANLADCSMTLLAGHFAMALVVDAPSGATADDLAATLDRVASALELDVSVRPLSDVAAASEGEPYVVSVYGADHPGIVAQVAAELAELGVNITDLETRVVGGEDAVYAMLLEVGVPPGLDQATLRDRLGSRAEALGVEVSLHPTDADVL